MYYKRYQVGILFIFTLNIFTMNTNRDIWKYGSCLLFFEWVDLIKENKEMMDDISSLLTWFPNFWVRKVILFCEN